MTDHKLEIALLRDRLNDVSWRVKRLEAGSSKAPSPAKVKARNVLLLLGAALLGFWLGVSVPCPVPINESLDSLPQRQERVPNWVSPAHPSIKRHATI